MVVMMESFKKFCLSKFSKYFRSLAAWPEENPASQPARRVRAGSSSTRRFSDTKLLSQLCPTSLQDKLNG